MSLPKEKLQQLIQSKMTGFSIDDKGNKTEHEVRINPDGSVISLLSPNNQGILSRWVWRGS